MKDYEAVVFDMDGVIFDSEKASLGCWVDVAERHGVPDMEKTIHFCIGITAVKSKAHMLDVYGQDFPYEEYKKEVVSLFQERYGNGKLPLKPGVREILEFLKTSGKKIALASSTQEKNVRQRLSDAGIIDYFDEIIAGDMAKKSKPDPEIFLLACDKIDVKPADAIAVEDSHNGIRAAYAGGLRVVMIPDLLPADEEMRAKAEKVLNSLNDLMAYLKEQEEGVRDRCQVRMTAYR